MMRPLRALIIDDSADDAELLIRDLKREGYELSTERTNTAAGLTAALDAQEWDIVLCDYDMPRLSGLEALEIVRGRGLDIPFIFVSGAVGEDAAIAAMKAGAQDYVMKGQLKRLAPAIARELRDAAVRHERTQVEARRHSLEMRYRQILSIAPDAIVALDESLNIAMFNHAAERLFGYGADEAVGQNADVLLPARLLGPFREQVMAFADSSADSMQVASQHRLFARRKTGEEFPAEIYISKLEERSRTIFTAIIRDITDRETMVATLRQANQTLDAVVQSSPFAILAIDSAHRVVTWNRNAERIFGLSAGEAVGRSFVSIENAVGADVAPLVHRLLDGETLRDLELQLQRDDNPALDVRVSGAPLHESDRRGGGAICVVEDVTDIKATRRQLEHAQRMEAVGQLTGGLAHDFNNLLAVVIGNLDILQDFADTHPPAKEPLDLALKASMGGATLIKQLLAFSRRQALSPKPFDLNALVASTRELMARTLGEHIEVRMRLAADLAPALADAAQLESAIANLAI